MTDSILIVGGGIAGLHAAIECANAGARAIVVERGPVIGGRLAATMTAADAIGDRAEGARTPLFEALTANDRIEIITQATVTGIEGRPGNFTVGVRERARFVTDACTRCKLCRAVCPVVLANEYDAGLTFRKAIYTPMGETYPEPYVIDIENCLNTPPNYLPCNRCVQACEDDAIHFDVPLETVHEKHVGAVVLAPGFQVEDGARYRELGYGSHPDILTSAELQRLLESPGPTGGYASKPSNEEYPDSVLIVLDEPSHFALYIVASQVRQLLEQDIETVAVLVLSPLSDPESYREVQELAARSGVQVRWGASFRVEANPENEFDVSYEDLSSRQFAQEKYGMVVLCTDVEPPSGLEALASALEVELDDHGYIRVSGANGAGVATSRPGIYVAGCASGPRNIRESIEGAQSAASAALAELDPRQLGADAPATDVRPQAAAASASPDEMRARIEQLLYALIGQPNG